ncbi:hypothetical protein F5Y06DRAFT_209753 [Hypoxylon sp. FL0890]|nr:hypothetical protein F5Y06DRAFT_209753 [Hypoxylon sp. FL0890]
MDKADTPPSPAPSNSTNHPTATADEVLQSQFQQLIQHNASAPPVDVHSQISSTPHSRYSSPAPQQQQMAMPIYDHGSPYSTAPPAPTYSGGYQQQSYQMEPSPYPQLPDTGSSLTPHNAYSTPATSPPTPLQTDRMTTRSGREISRPHGGTPALMPQPSRSKKASPKPSLTGAGVKKQKKRRGKGSEAVVLEAPLSELVKNITAVQDTNIEEYVNRATDVRKLEVKTAKEQKIKRPMNAFMLYRKAYQNRTKEWKKHDNHQVISQVCGTSWNMEPQELRDQYDNWAKIERENHRIAFPEYKFAPSKSKNKKTGGSGSRTRVDSDDDGSDLEGYEWEVSAPPSRNASRAGRPIYDPDAEYHPAGMRSSYPAYPSHQSPPMAHHARLPYPPAHQSSFGYSNPGKPRPAEYGAGLGQNQYYQQTTSYPHHMYGGALPGHVPSYVENVYMNKANSPAGSFHTTSPVDHAYDMMGSAYPPPQPHPQHQLQHHQPQVAMPHREHHPIDPSLMGQQGGVHQYDTLGILSLGDHHDGIQHYTLDQTPLGGHSNAATVGVDDGMANHHSQQQFDQAFHQTPHDGGVETTWNDEPSIQSLHEVSAKLEGGEWETTLEGPDFDIDHILGTTDSPGG